MNIEELYNLNGIKSDKDLFYLVRQTSKVPRCHTLPVKETQTLSQHMINSVYLLDFASTNNKINPVVCLHLGEMNNIRDWLLYHDVEEVLLGDIPFFLARRFDDISDSTRNSLVEKFRPKRNVLSSNAVGLAKQIDMLEFLITMKGELSLDNSSTYNKRRLLQCYDNGLKILQELVEKSFYKIDYRYFLEE